MMARMLNTILFIALVVASMLHASLAQPTPSPVPTLTRAPMTYIVGDNIGWTVPSGGPNAYQTWARGQNFVVGDVLVFNFPTGAHDVAEVSKMEYDSCNINLNTNSITDGPVRITLPSAGEHYYMCTVPSHCSLGQRLVITVVDVESSTSVPPSSSTPTPSTKSPSFVPTPMPSTHAQSFVPPPPNNSAPTFAKVLPFTFMVVALAFLYN